MYDPDSILQSTKNLLGISEDDDGFDGELVLLINGVFMTLLQLGIGPESGFSITGPDETWDSYNSDALLTDSIKTYLYLKVRMLFDPPASSTVAEAFNGRIAELESRLNWQAEQDREKAEGAAEP